ncbi:tRNA1(Val) (adenine(37)-N6)-methyltransferase [Candidatus Magnetaquicoccaceae bacterium FCR-1]|uniref:tRNA1(Val) (Adenine(37)-N6)-methyltransferase n=1 Tax=Candidatus Magnetaquiglobus chichijimensis TaxID=3141448 RepID=A0ABQ0CDI5_9PROT
MKPVFQGLPPGLCRRVGGGIEAGLLAGEVGVEAGERVAELGCGCGEVAVRLALAHPSIRVDGLEIQPELCTEARHLVERHALTERVRVVEGDVRDPPPDMAPGGYDRVVCNPPFFALGAGRLPPERSRAMARFEQTGGLGDFLRCGALLLRAGGVMTLMHRPERLVELLTGGVARGLNPERLVPVHADPAREAILLLVGLRKGGSGGMVVAPSRLVEKGARGAAG